MNPLTVYAGDWVLPIVGPPIRDGLVVVDQGLIVWVGARRELPSRFQGGRLRASPRSLILPGWVNAHCHLQLTAAVGQLSGRGDDFTAWVRDLLRLTASWPPELLQRSIIAGLDLLGKGGTTTVAHLATLPEPDSFLDHPLRTVLFHEVIGFPAARSESLAAAAEDWLTGAGAVIQASGSTRHTLGLAPHAVYSVSPALIRSLGRMAVRHGVAASIHLAETTDEERFLQSGDGPFRDLLVERGAWDSSWRPPGDSPARYLKDLGFLQQLGVGAVAHANYLSDADVHLLRESGATVVWCPGSHRWFGHRNHPIPRLLAAGVPLALGTDSLASNRGLDMLREVRLAAESFPDVPREVWLEAATLGGARSLGLADRVGGLTPGLRADLQILECEADGTEAIRDPLRPLFEGRPRVESVLVDGERLRIR